MGKWLAGLSDVMMKFVQIITYYAPIAFFAIFADLVATYGCRSRHRLWPGPDCCTIPCASSTSSPPSPSSPGSAAARHGVKTMFQHIARPAVMSLGTCSSAATIPTNLEEARGHRHPQGRGRHGACLMGATMHMDGSCFSCVLKIAFVLGAHGR